VSHHVAARPPAWLLALLFVVAFAFQGTRGIWEPDEGRYSSAGIHMHENGDWLVPTVDGEHPHLTKPPLTYWALAASFALLGHHEWAARLPGALAFIATGLFVFGLGRRLCPVKPWLPPTVWALSFAPAVASNIVSTDPILASLETAAMYAFVEAWSRDGAGTRRWFLAMWLAWGLAFLTKGPPGLLPLLGMVVFVAVHERRHLRPMFAPAGPLLFAVVAFTWFAVLIAQQPDRLRYFLGYEVYDRLFTAAHDRNARWYGAIEVYLPMLLVGTLPWSALAVVTTGGPRAAWHQWRDRLRQRRPEWLLLAYWLLVPLAVLCLARSRLQLYVLPLFVPLALILSRPLAHWHECAARRFAAVVLAATVAMVAFKGALAYWPSDRDARAIAAQLRASLASRPVDGIVFVGMRPYFGLNVYLDVAVEGVQIGERKFEYSKYLAPEDVCAEIATPERNVYAIKLRHAAKFVAAVGRCGAAASRLGTVRADGHDIELFEVVPAVR
jgi:4-amino-4-deoxy-L-arabinose transferase-like glycosyltransferase